MSSGNASSHMDAHHVAVISTATVRVSVVLTDLRGGEQRG
jgi:hypothetical protein